MRRHDDKKASLQASINSVLTAVKPKFGELRFCPSFKPNQPGILEWSFRPPVSIAGRNLNGKARNARDYFTLELPANSEAEAVQERLSAALLEISNLATQQRASLLEQIKVLDELIAAS